MQLTWTSGLGFPVSDFRKQLFHRIGFSGIRRQPQLSSQLRGSYVVFLRLSENHSEQVMSPGDPVLRVQSCCLSRMISCDVDLVEIEVRHCAVEIDISGNPWTELYDL